ncbi:MAG: methylenetetrahydrofolate reductase [NAD(P)H] [Opitutales bacterium]
MSLRSQVIAEKLQQGKPLLSVEFFPPKNEEGARQILRTANRLKRYDPDFVSITYGAGGGTRERTLAYGELLKEIFDFNVMPHLTCVGHSRDELRGIIGNFERVGFRNIMALRGDPPKGETEFKPHPDGLHYGSELVAFIRENFPEFGIGVGGYPEVHPDSQDVDEDLKWLKHKVDQGADFITTQLFFTNNDFFAWQQKLRDLGADCPIIPGILPALSAGQLKRLTQFCKATLPQELVEQLEACGDDDIKARGVGVDWAYSQVKELIESGSPGVHLYIMNRHDSAETLIERLQNDGLIPKQG